MDWKRAYRAELEDPARRPKPELLFLGTPLRTELADDVRRGAVLSFPHTYLEHAAPLHAHVIRALRAANVRRVVALGVLHGAFLPPPFHDTYRLATAPEGASSTAAFAQLRGGFMPAEPSWPTPFGSLPLWHVRGQDTSVLRRDRRGLLANEYSLDTFLALVRLESEIASLPPLQVLPLFVGPTRAPEDGALTTADALASALKKLVTADSAVVATGDLVHYGAIYRPLDPALAGQRVEDAERHFRDRTQRTLDLALRHGDQETAYRHCVDDLASDQRYILPVIAALLGIPAAARIVSFTLSDYSGILETPPPCWVASALVVFHRVGSSGR